MTTFILVVLLLPFVWGAGIWLTRRYAMRTSARPADADEKQVLILMTAPVVLGLGVLAIARLFAVHLPVPLPLPLAGDLDGGFMLAAGPAATAQAPLSLNVWHMAPLMILGAYAAVAAVLALRLLMTYVRLARVCSDALPKPDLGDGVHVSERTGIALAWGRATVLLPLHLLPHLSPVQTGLIIHHERAHLARRDPLYFAVLSWLDVCLWFNPFVRAQTRQCRLAAELDCDARVTGASPEMRETYAETLIMALKHAAGNARQCVPAAFSPAESGDYRMRISEIMHPGPVRRKARLWIAAVGSLLLVPIGLAQLAWSQAPARLETTVSATPAALFTAMPVDGRLSSGFGIRKNPVTGETSMHEGVDIATPIGLPVRAPAGGRVTRADEAEPWFGKVLDIDHGGGVVTRYKHLGGFEVKVGDTVMAGQTVAKSGNTGRTTGPHVHIGVFENGKAVDPAGRMPLPNAD